MGSFRLTPRASFGLSSIVEHCARQLGSRVAEDVLDRLLAALENLARRPGLGRVREDITADEALRFWSVGPTLIAYREASAGIEVLFIERGERDWTKLLQGGAVPPPLPPPSP